MGPRRRGGRETTRSRSEELQNGTEHVVGRIRQSHILVARQRQVNEKEFMMASRRAQRLHDKGATGGCTVGVTRPRNDGKGDTSTTPLGTKHKRRRVITEDADDSRIEMDVDDVRSPSFSPSPVSPSRRPWQLRPPPETRPDADGNLTRPWLPPVSPYGLIEEDHAIFSDPFKLLVVCQLLNKTTATVVRHLLYRERFFETYPSADVLAEADENVLEDVMRPLGLWRKRASGLKRFAKEYRDMFYDVYTEGYRVNANMRVGELYGCGEYAVDAWDIFVLGAWRGLRPKDKDLGRYVEFLERTEGLGVGFTRSAGGTGYGVRR